MIRELTVNEVEDVSGGNPLLVGAAVGLLFQPKQMKVFYILNQGE